MTTKDFQYHSLDRATDEIRLVTIKAGAATDPIRCTLSEYRLNEIPLYEALSYAWGNAAETEAIYLDEFDFQVTKNLNSALHHLRQEREDRVMWIDAICIDQENDQEKNHQVRMMKRIYETAEQVVVWLGEGIEYVGVVFEKLKFLQSFGEQDRTFMKIKDLKELFGLEAWAAFKSLFRMEWWKRIWVIQEVEVASKILVVCGQDQIPAEYFDAALVSIIPIFYSDLPGFREEIFTPSTVKRTEYQSRDLLFRASRHRDRHSTDPRDKLYALIGIADEMEFEPDYSLSVLDVYQKFVKTCIQRSGTLDVLNFATSFNEITTPSWIPDWSKSIGRTPFHQYNGWGKVPYFNASGGTVASFDTLLSLARKGGETFPDGHPPVGSRVGIVKGFITDTVALQGDPLMNPDVEISPNSALMQQWISMCQSQSTDKGPYKTTEDLRTAFCLTLVGDLMIQPHPTRRASKNLESFFVGFLDWMSNERSIHYTSAINAYACQGNLLVATLGKRFFISKKGYFGLVSHEAQPGDLICILFGGQTPFILRKLEFVTDTLKEAGRVWGGDGNIYRLVSDCYVHGIMDGEAYEEFKAGKSGAKEQNFVLT